jgi:hypothetical protein
VRGEYVFLAVMLAGAFLFGCSGGWVPESLEYGLQEQGVL